MSIRFARLWVLLAVSCLLGVGLSPDAAGAETRTAAALTPEAVWEVIAAAQDGDTVQLPAGTAVWKKGWNTGHWAKMKAITIQGAGIDKTIIRDDTSRAAGDEPFVIKGVEGKPFRITGITFDGTGLPDAGVWAGEIVIEGNCKNFRVDHCKFLNMDRMMTISGDTYGLIDHCSFHVLKKNRLAQTIMYQGPGAANYRKPLSLGSAAAVYFEDNEAHFGPEVVNLTGNNPWIVPSNGARTVIRHNKIVNSQLEIYRPGMSQGLYGSQSVEIYDNAFSAVGLDNYRPQCFITIGAGVAIVFNNTVTGTTYNVRQLELRNERAWRDLPGFPKADGKNPLDGNQIPAGQLGAGYPCFGQVGWATNVDGIFKPSPCYAWNNTFNGAPLRMETSRRADANEATTIKEGRDFFNKKPPEEYYKPYVYPHPLQAEEPARVFVGYVFQQPPKIEYGLYTHLFHAFLTADEDGKIRTSRNCPSRPLVIGAHQAGNYNDIAKLLADRGWTRKWDDETKNPWAVAPDASAVIGYDDAESIALKTEWTMKQGLRGVFFWQIRGDLLPDGTFPLQTAARKKWESAGKK